MLEGSKIAVPFRWRHMQPADVDECVDIIAADPVIGARYGAGIRNLGHAWRRLLGSAAITHAVIDRLDQTRARIVGVGVDVFVRDEFIREIKAPPLFWIGPELARRVMGRDSPVLRDDEVRAANSGHGLNVLVWESIGAPGFAQTMDFFHLMVGGYVETHRGFLLKEMISAQAASIEQLLGAVEAGGLYWNPAHQNYEKAPPEPCESFAALPHLIGITRELELARRGSWVSTLFDYHPPRFGFSRGEQRLLVAAMSGPCGTDQELASSLCLSLPT